MPTVATVYLDRPAILTPVRDRVRALIGNFGVSDDALIDVLSGKAAPLGKLPFDLPSSMDVRRGAAAPTWRTTSRNRCIHSASAAVIPHQTQTTR